MKTCIHVNGQNLRNNKVRKDNGKRNTVFVCQKGRQMASGTRVVIHGPSQLVYRPNKKLDYHGAKVSAWIETKSPVCLYWGRERIWRSR